jgi:hypothetical protein
MNRPCLAAILACTLLASVASGARAQDPKKPEPATEPPATGAAKDPAAIPAPRPGDPPDPRIIEGIMTCLAAGLPPEWKKAWFVIKEIDRNVDTSTRQFEGDFFYATRESDRKGKRLRTCGAEQIIEGVGLVNDYLTPEQQRWTSVTFTFLRTGNYDVKYDYTPVKPKPAPKAASKKKQESAK